MSEPLIVAIETSGRQGSVALARGDELLAVSTLDPQRRHAVELMPAIEQMTRRQGWKPADISQIYLSLGPGSFTGLRIAVAAARAMAHAIRCKLVGVPSLHVIAENVPADFGLVLPILDAKRGQVFAAAFQRQHDGSLRQIRPAALYDPRKFVEEMLTSPGNALIAILGEGVDYHRGELFSHNHARTAEIDRNLWIPTASTVHRLGRHMAVQGLFSDPHRLVPIYIRLPEAEEVYRKKYGLG